MKEYLLYVYAESPVHAGGIPDEGVVDLPIQRESSTNLPVIWGQSLKGALRQAARDRMWPDDLLNEVFGAEDGVGGAGKLIVGDAQLVAMPVPTLTRTFAWVASSTTLARLGRKRARLQRTNPTVPAPLSDAGVSATQDWNGTDMILGPAVVNVQTESDARLWADILAAEAISSEQEFKYFATKLRQDLIVAGEDVAAHLFERCTEVNARVQLDDNKTVAQGPFYSEYLPAESILAASIGLRPVSPRHATSVETKLHELLGITATAAVQVGGDETLGKGLVWLRLHQEAV